MTISIVWFLRSNFKNPKGADSLLSSGKRWLNAVTEVQFLQMMSPTSEICLGPASSALPEEGWVRSAVPGYSSGSFGVCLSSDVGELQGA